MHLTAIGDCQILLQTYKYKNVRIICAFKIYPNAYEFHEQKQMLDYHWMTSSRWSRIENGLRKHIEGTDNLPLNVAKLHAEMQIDHIKTKVSVSSKEWLTAVQTILCGTVASSKEQLIGLDIALHYLSHEDIIPKGSPSKRKHVSAVPASGSGQTRHKHRSKGQTVKTSDGKEQTSIKVKRERRSISQSDDRNWPAVKPSSSSNGHVSLKDKPVTNSNSRCSSVEPPKPMRRSARSPVQPQRFHNFILDRKTPLRGSTKNKSTEGPTIQPYKFEQLDGSAIGALQQLDNVLKTTTPREVKILLLDKKSQSDILGTFEKYEKDFRCLFERRADKQQTVSYLGIGHLDVMDILNKSIQKTMIQKLGDVYCKKSSHGSLIINGLLPLWIIRLFMDEYKFQCEDDAAKHIKDQLKYTSYLKALNDDPLSSDLED